MDHPIVSIKKMELFVPKWEEIAKVLQHGLKCHFEETTVEWVDCPDLTQEPFNLAKSGLRGNAIIVEINEMCFPFSEFDHECNIKRIIKKVHTYSNSGLIIGASIGLRQSAFQFGDLIMNASYSRQAEGNIEIINQSRLALFDKTTGRYALDLVTDFNPYCYPNGNFFVSEGKPGQVLKVWAKKRIGLQFLTALQSTLAQKYSSGTSPKVVGLGGTFVMKSGRAKHHVISHHQWDTRITASTNLDNWLYYCDLDAPLVAVGTLLSSNHSCPNTSTLYDLDICGLTETHFHAYSSDGVAGGHFYKDLESMDPVEYLGYFCPARILNRVVPQLQ
ncbi:ester hydrolase C11orf54 homolog [Polyergus mexicanus]|uniref:ester hydrolase C11orf54 homolog n=1 Tax=Polyergus mexicanus TaxID=615972 RepID=UPI0038B66665